MRVSITVNVQLEIVAEGETEPGGLNVIESFDVS